MDYNEQELKLARFFVEREGEGILDVLREIDLFEAGIMDSLDLVSLGVFIEKTFGRKIDLTDPGTLAAARSFDALAALIGAK